MAPLPHSTKEDTKLRGYEIPRNTIVLFNMYAIQMDERNWKEPLLFRPERFLDSHNNVIKPDAFVPFGLGK